MRKNLLLTIMCLFALCGNLLAQDTITVGTGTGETDSSIPMHTWYRYTYSQQIYTAEEINHAAGFITEIAFFTNDTKINREVTVYMINTEKESFSDRTDWVDVDVPDIVYDGFVTCNTTMSIQLQNKFEYTGGNILICVQDKTGLEISSTSFNITKITTNKTIYISSDNALITPENVSTRSEMSWNTITWRNDIRLIFEEIPVAEEGAPETPANFTAEALSQTEIKLTWNTVADATSYNIYSEDTLVANVTDTTYVVTGLDAETKYLYKVSALNDDKLESLPTANVSVTTLRNPEIIVTPANISLGDIILGEFWSETNDKSVTLSLECIETEITKIECENEFFVLPENIDFTANPVTLEITYDDAALSLGEKTAELVITCAHGEERIPVTANVYTPVSPDAFELAEEITFDGGSFTATPDFENLHDIYNLPNEVNAGATPDAVYSFELDKTQSVTVDVKGTNAVYAIYKAEDLENNGPKADNNYAGESGAPSTFFYDFSEENVLDNFTLLDEDGDGYNWYIANSGINGKSLSSESWKSGVGALTPDNYIVTKEKYAIKSTSKLSFSYFCNWPEKFGVEVSTDNINFESVWEEEGKFNATNPYSSAEILLAEYEGQELYIALRHYESTDGQYFYIDNFQLSNNDGDFVTFPVGKYYLVAAAEDAFTVNVVVGANPEELPAAPQNLRVDNVTSTTVTLSWDAVAEAQSYSVYQGTKLVADKIEATTYTVENLEAYKEYAFSVRSFDGEYNSFSSSEVKATTNDYVIEAPANVAVTGLDAYSVKISWDAVEHAMSYNVYQNDKKIASELTATMFTVEDLVPETEYCFVVSSVRRDMEKKAEAACGKTLAIDFSATDFASTFLFDFNNQSFDGLRTIDADDDGNNWKIGNEGQGYNETYAARSDSYYGEDLNPDNYLVTKVPYMIDSTSKVTLNARIGYEMEMYAGEHYAVVVTENGKDWNVVFEETLNDIDWTNTSVSLKAYAGKAVLVGVRHYDCKHTNRSFILVDNFALTSDNNTTPEEPGDDVNPDDPIVPENPTDSITPSPSDSLTLAAPVVTATATSDSTIVLTWNAVEGAESYNVYQVNNVVAVATAVKDTTYTVTGLKAETEYAFTVTAVNAAGESVESAEAKATTLKAEGLEELSAAINIYPNPVQNELFLATEVRVEEVAIYDIYGRQQAISYQLSVVSSIDVAELNSGVYFVKIVTSNGEIVKRFIKN